MNDLPRHTLSQIIAKHGAAICDTPKRLEAMLRDLCGANRREINIIMGALEERIAADLTAAGSSVPGEVLLSRLEARLRDNLAYTPEAAHWGVETWAFALGILSEAELQERARKESAAGQTGAPIAQRDSGQSGANPPSARPQAPASKRSPTYVPPQQLPQSPSTGTPAPAPGKVRRLPPSIVVTEPQQHDPSPTPRRVSRRGLTLRGCLIVVVLAIVLIITAIFVVPAVIMVLREEQAHPSINEPRTR